MEDGNKIKVLLSENEEALRLNLCKLFRDCEETELIGSSGGGEEMVSLALEKEADVILMDTGGNGRNEGIEAARRISELRPGVSIVMLGPSGDKSSIFEAYCIPGIKDYLFKTDSKGIIIGSVRRAYDERMLNTMQSTVLYTFPRFILREKVLTMFINTLCSLTPTERDIIRLLLADMSASRMARERGVELVTVKTQVSSLLRKFKLKRKKQIKTMIELLHLESLFG